MIDVKNVLEVINQVLVLPIAIITFFLLIYIVIYLSKKDPDVIRSRIFLKYNEIKKVFILLVLFAFVLLLHVTFIFYPNIFNFILEEPPSFIDDLQQILGLVLVIILITFVFLIYRGIKDSSYH